MSVRMMDEVVYLFLRGNDDWVSHVGVHMHTTQVIFLIAIVGQLFLLQSLRPLCSTF